MAPKDDSGKSVRKAVRDAASAQAVKVKEAAASSARLVMSDIWQAIRSDRKAQLLVALLIIALVGWDMPYISTVLYPFKLFVTMIHESCHALVARFTGGNVASISLAPDESGLTYVSGGNLILFASAGYPGAAIFGSLLIWWGRKPAQARMVLHSIGTVLLALTIFWAQINLFSFVTMLLISIALIVVASKAQERVCHVILLMLGAITALASLASIRTILTASIFGLELTVPNDADIVAKATGVPAVLLELLWGLIALSSLIFSFWISYRPQQKKEAVAANAGGNLPDKPQGSDSPTGEKPGQKSDVVSPTSVPQEATHDASTGQPKVSSDTDALNSLMERK